MQEILSGTIKIVSRISHEVLARLVESAKVPVSISTADGLRNSSGILQKNPADSKGSKDSTHKTLVGGPQTAFYYVVDRQANRHEFSAGEYRIKFNFNEVDASSFGMKIKRATKEMEEDILREVKYSRQQLMMDLQVLKDWIKQQKHLPQSRLEEPDECLLQLLIGAKGSLENVKRKINTYYAFRSFCPIFQQRDNIELLKQAAKSQRFLVLPELLPDGCVAVMVGTRNADVNLYDAINAGRWLFAAGEYLVRHTGIVRAKYILVDATNFTVAHALKTTPNVVRSGLAFIQEALPVRAKKIIIFNAPSFAESFLNKLVRPFMKPKIQERLIVTSESIGKVFDYPEHLPEDYGGKYPPAAKLAEEWERAVFNWSYLPTLEERVDESLKPRKSDDYDPFMSMHGSIKTLVID